MKSSLFAKALIKFISGLIITIILIFIPAGSVRFLNGWIFIALLFVPMFIAGFVIAGLNYRFSWLVLPSWVTAAASVIFMLSYIMYSEVLRENEYLSRTIEVQENQKVVDTGLYSVIRHPMYSATILLFLSIPLILGSLYSFVVFLIYPFAIIARLKNEEQLLEKDLAGYTEYKKKVKYRLIPFIF